MQHESSSQIKPQSCPRHGRSRGSGQIDLRVGSVGRAGKVGWTCGSGRLDPRVGLNGPANFVDLWGMGQDFESCDLCVRY